MNQQNPNPSGIRMEDLPSELLSALSALTGQAGGGGQVAGQATNVSIDVDDEEEIVNAVVGDVDLFKALLEEVDPRDSAFTLAMFTHLQKVSRLHRVGSLEGNGDIFLYQEPKGSTQEGWTAGGTVGDRVVDKALAQATEANGGKAPGKRGLCGRCMSVVVDNGGTLTKQDAAEGEDPTVCNGGQPHLMVG